MGVSNYPLVHKGKKIVSEQRAILWKDGELVELYPVPYGKSEAIAINENGQALIVLDNSRVYFLNIESDESKLLGNSRGPIKPRLNDKGDVILRGLSYYEFVESSGRHITKPLAALVKDSSCYWKYVNRAMDMNNSDWIVGIAFNIYGETHAVLLIPSEKCC